MRISILGCGWFGGALADFLRRKGHEVKGSSRTPGKPAYVVEVTKEISLEFLDCEVLVVCCGAEVGRLPEYELKRVIYISSTGVYGDGEVDENSPPLAKPHFLAEQKLRKFNLTVIRFAGLVGPGRHPGRFLAGKTDLPNAASPVNLIHLDDCLGLTEALLERPDIRLINGVSPDHPGRRTFYRLASAVPPQFNTVQAHYKRVRTIYPEVYEYQIKDWLSWLKS